MKKSGGSLNLKNISETIFKTSEKIYKHMYLKKGFTHEITKVSALNYEISLCHDNKSICKDNRGKKTFFKSSNKWKAAHCGFPWSRRISSIIFCVCFLFRFSMNHSNPCSECWNHRQRQHKHWISLNWLRNQRWKPVQNESMRIKPSINVMHFYLKCEQCIDIKYFTVCIWCCFCDQQIVSNVRHRFQWETLQFIIVQNKSLISSSARYLYAFNHLLIDTFECNECERPTQTSIASINNFLDEKVKENVWNNCENWLLLEIIFHFSSFIFWVQRIRQSDNLIHKYHYKQRICETLYQYTLEH